ncbi:hypothetical protein BJ166DRAFT_611880 [Pestalotiopsis sp. NC0098]|nr:hypothetical protein BJ166DRAFT_611880 [Pestalotiopsis sp. NC0098]
MLPFTITLGLLAGHALAKRHKSLDFGEPYHFNTNTVTLANTATATSSTIPDFSQTNFYILDAQEESEIQLWNILGSNQSGYTTFWTPMPPDGFLGGLPVNLFTLSEKGNLIYVGPDASLTGRAAYTDGYWFLFLEPDSNAARQLDLCTCDIDSATWQLSCQCGGTIENCNSWLIEDSDFSCRLWYAHPYSPSNSAETTSAITREPPAAIRSSTTTRHLAQPTFAVYNAGGLEALGFSSIEPTGTNPDIAFANIFPLGSQQPLTFTLNERGNLVLINPGLPTTGYIAYASGEHGDLVFGRPDDAPVGAHECTCAIDSWSYQFRSGVDGDLMWFCTPDNPKTGELIVCPGVDWNASWVNLYAAPVIPI